MRYVVCGYTYAKNVEKYIRHLQSPHHQLQTDRVRTQVRNWSISTQRIILFFAQDEGETSSQHLARW